MKNNFFKKALKFILNIPLLEIAIVLWPVLSAYQYHFSSVGLLFVIFAFLIRLIRLRKISIIIDKWYFMFVGIALILTFICVIGTKIDVLELKNFATILIYVLLTIMVSPILNRKRIEIVFIVAGLIFAIGIFYQSIFVYFLNREVRPIRFLPLPTKDYYANRFLSYQNRPMGFFMEPAAYAIFAIFPMLICIFKKRYESFAFIFISSVLSGSTFGYLTSFALLVLLFYRIISHTKNKKWIIAIVALFVGLAVGIVFVGIQYGFFGKLFSSGSSTLNRVISGFEVFWELPLFNKFFGINTTNLTQYLNDNSIIVPANQRVTLGFVNGYSYILNFYGLIGFALFVAFLVFFIKRNTSHKKALVVLFMWLIMMFGDSCIFNTHYCLFIICAYLFTNIKEYTYVFSIKKKTKGSKSGPADIDNTTSTKRNKNRFALTGLVMIILSILLSLLSFVKELVFAHTYGSTGAASAFTLASELPLTIFAVFSVAITSIVIPLFSKKYYSQGKKEADLFVSNLLTIFGIISLVFTILIFAFADSIISLIASSWENDPQYEGMHEIATIVLRFSSFLIICNSIIDTTTGVLNFYHKFITPRFLTGLRNIIFILVLVSLHNMFGIYAALIGLLSGIVLETIIFFIIFCRNVKFKPDLRKKDGMLKEAIKIAIPILIGSGADELTGLVDKVVASSLESSAISNLSYAFKPTSIITNIIVGSIHTMVFPIMAKNAQTSDDDNFKKTLNSSFLVSLILALPLVVGGIIISKDLVYLLYARGALESDFSSLNTISILFAIYMSLAFFAVSRSLFIKAFYSNKNTVIPVIFVSGGVILNTALNCLFVFAFKMGVTSLAYSSLISTAISSICIIIIFSKKYINIFDKDFLLSALKIVIASVLMGGAVFFVNTLASGTTGIIKVLFEVFVGFVFYLLLLVCLKEQNSMFILKSISNRVQIERPISKKELFISIDV